jgi:hypothetical protein
MALTNSTNSTGEQRVILCVIVLWHSLHFKAFTVCNSDIHQLHWPVEGIPVTEEHLQVSKHACFSR